METLYTLFDFVQKNTIVMITIWTPETLSPGQPVYAAITTALAMDIRSGRLESGARLPPVRKLAVALKVTMGTVHRAYTLAEKKGLITSVMGSGSFVKQHNEHEAFNGSYSLPLDENRNCR